MTAVEKTLQDQLKRVEDKAEGKSDKPEDENPEKDTTEDPEPADEQKGDEVDSKPEGDEDKPEERKEPTEEQKKDAAAFAAMRRKLKELEDENKRLKETSEEKPPEEEGTQEKPEEDKKAKALEDRLREAEEYINNLKKQQQQYQVTQEVANLKAKYELSNDELTEFAQELDRQGYKLDDPNMPLENMYLALNHDKIMQREVEKAKKEIAAQYQDTAPSTGPKSKGGDNKETTDVRSTLERVGKKVN